MKILLKIEIIARGPPSPLLNFFISLQIFKGEAAVEIEIETEIEVDISDILRNSEKLFFKLK